MKVVEGERTRFFVVGVGHRFPMQREVSAAVARTLMESSPCRYEWTRAARGRTARQGV